MAKWLKLYDMAQLFILIGLHKEPITIIIDQL